MSITEKDGRILLTCRAGCPQEAVIKSIREAGLWGSSSGYEMPAPPPEADPTEAERRADRASDLWNEGHPVEPGDPVHKYLTGRGITLEIWPDDLRCHPALPYWSQDDAGKLLKIGTFPAMLAVVRNPEGRPVDLHRTYITSDGLKAPVTSPKKLYGVRPIQGGAVRLSHPRDGAIGLAEGIETALSVTLLCGEPCWSCVSAGGIERANLPEGISRVVVFADNDRNMSGQRAAAKAVLRFRSEGREARILVPDAPGYDFNDILKTKSALRVLA